MSVLELSSDLYPSNIKQILKPPKHLFYKCNFDLKPEYFKNCLAIVGSREMTPYGKDVLDHLFKTLDRSLTIVSGFMFGVDAYAHALAISYGMKTVAVLPCGVDKIYPSGNRKLYTRILDSRGVILSEYPGVNPVKRWTFCRRNRIMAGMSSATLVIEASRDSGSLNCADYADSFGRKVLVVPGNIFSKSSTGTNYLTNKYGIAVSSGEEINEHLKSLPLRLFFR